MRSRIFKVVTKEKVKEDKSVLALKADELYTEYGMAVPVADYIDDLPEKSQKEDIKDFLSMPGIIKTGDKTFMVDKNSYFGNRIYDLKKEVRDLTEAEFCGTEIKGVMKLYEISTMINDRCGYYIYKDYAETLDEWIREACETEEYCLGDVLDYHL